MSTSQKSSTRELMDRFRLIDVMELEKKRLDNRSVTGGFNRFLSEWGRQQKVPGWNEAESRLREYQALSASERSRLIDQLKQLIMQSSQPSVPQPAGRTAKKTRPHSRCLRQPVQVLKGVGPVLQKKFAQLGIDTIEGVLFHYPRTYRDRGDSIPFSDISEGRLLTVEGTIASHRTVPTRQKRLLKIGLTDGQRTVFLVCFNQDYLGRVLTSGKKVRVSGTFRFRFGQWETSDFDYELFEEKGSDPTGYLRYVPVYPLTEGLTHQRLTALVSAAVDEYLEDMAETVPSSLRTRYGLWTRQEAVREIHQPIRSEYEDLVNRSSCAHRSIIFEECLIFALGLQLKRLTIQTRHSHSYPPDSRLIRHFTSSLPFQLTQAQDRVFQEIAEDLSRSVPMTRLVQGDVGSGKTLIALLGALLVIGQGSQAALMVPTEILAEQHCRRWGQDLEKLGVRVGQLRGGGGKEKRNLLEAIARKKVDLIIGTHALIQEKVAFADLGLVIVDEQHRFGVTQRSMLQEKANSPHLLVMTATPIPRTLALTLYGDLDLSVVDEKPAGRKPVRTLHCSESERPQAYFQIAGFLKKGHQAYVVCPAIEENEDDLISVKGICDELRKKWLKEYRLAMVHGRLPAREKETIMERFVQREIDVLIATSVIEVGIDVPTANAMVIEQSDRFGLAQLHQLRGRIGRGTSEGLCILLTRSHHGPAVQRVRIMTTTDDGFVIAEEDLKIRGTGEFFGFRQHGLSEFRLADPSLDWVILEQATREAQAILERDPELKFPEHQALGRAIRARYGALSQRETD